VQRFPLLVKSTIIVVLLVLAIFIPLFYARVVLGLVAGILLALNLRKFSAFLITMLVLVSLIAVGASIAGQFLDRYVGDWLNIPGIPGFNWNSQWGPKETLVRLEPDRSVDMGEEVVVNMEVLELIGKQQATGLFVPSEISVRSVAGGMRQVVSYANNPPARVRMEIGDSQSLQLLDVYANVGAISGYFNTTEFRLKGNVLSFDLHLNGTKAFHVDSNVISGKIRYEEEWTGTRTLEVRCNTGSLDVYVPESCQDQLQINRDSNFFRLHVYAY